MEKSIKIIIILIAALIIWWFINKNKDLTSCKQRSNNIKKCNTDCDCKEGYYCYENKECRCIRPEENKDFCSNNCNCKINYKCKDKKCMKQSN